MKRFYSISRLVWGMFAALNSLIFLYALFFKEDGYGKSGSFIYMWAIFMCQSLVGLISFILDLIFALRYFKGHWLKAGLFALGICSSFYLLRLQLKNVTWGISGADRILDGYFFTVLIAFIFVVYPFIYYRLTQKQLNEYSGPPSPKSKLMEGILDDGEINP